MNEMMKLSNFGSNLVKRARYDCLVNHIYKLGELIIAMPGERVALLSCS